MDMNNNVKKHMDDLLARYPDLRGTADKIHVLLDIVVHIHVRHLPTGFNKRLHC